MCFFICFNHRTSTNFTVRPASATGDQENDNDDRLNAGNVAELSGLKTENCDGGMVKKYMM